jgi:hypothetical protein
MREQVDYNKKWKYNMEIAQERKNVVRKNTKIE